MEVDNYSWNQKYEEHQAATYKQRDTTETTEDKNPVAPLTESHRREKYPIRKQNSYHMVISHQRSERAGLKGPSHAK